MFKAFVLALIALPFFHNPVNASVVVVLRDNEFSYMSKCNDGYGRFIVTDLKKYFVEANSASYKQGAPDLNPGKCGYFIFDTKNEFPDQPGFHGSKASDAVLQLSRGLNTRGKPIKCPNQIMSVYETASNNALIDACFE